MHDMKAALLLRERLPFDDDAFAELVIWRLPRQAPGSAHPYKYHLAFVIGDECVLRFDNEAGKGYPGNGYPGNGYRWRTRARELIYEFKSPEKLVQAFLREARRIHHENRVA